jgi:uncharacterized protein (TIGR03086 family)
MTAITDRYRTLADAFEAKVAAVPPDAWSNPSPCAEWNARQLVSHVIDVHGMMLKPLDRSLSEAPSADDDPLGAFRAARADVEDVLADPELAGTEYDGAFGRTKVERTIDQFMAFDLVVHGWDLARATGQDDTIDPAEVDTIMAFAEPMGDTMRENGVTGPAVAVPDDAPQQDRMLGLLGRDPS